jgi:hypothetical protein
MTTILGVLNFVLFIALIAGLIKPANILIWSNNPTRFKVFGIWLLITIVITTLGVLSVDEEERSRTKIEEAKNNIEEKEYGLAILKLKEITEERPLYTDAQKLLLEVDSMIKIEDSLNIIKEKKNQIALEIKIKSEKEEESKRVRDRERSIANATNKLDKKYDDMTEVTWYHDKTSPKYVNYNGFFAYIGTSKGSSPVLRLAIQYAADDWLFVKKYIIKVDGVTYTIEEKSYGEIKTDNGEGGIWEWLDRQVGISEFEVIKAVANGKDVKIRFSGKDYYKDKKITNQQKLALKNIITAYEALGGTMN